MDPTNPLDKYGVKFFDFNQSEYAFLRWFKPEK